MAQPIDVFSGSISNNINWNAQDNIPGSNPVTNGINSTQAASYTTGTNQAGRANQALYLLLTIAGAGNTTIDLTTFLNAVNLSAASFARVKGIRIRLLSTAQVAADGSTPGSAATHIVIGNNATNDFTSQSGGRGWLGTATSTFELPNGGWVAFGTDNDVGVLVDGTHKIIKITNGDASVAAKVEVAVIGSDA